MPAPAHLAVRRVVQSGKYPQQGGFPDSRRSHERSDGAGAHVQIDVPQQDGVTRRIVDIGAARAVVASHVLSWRRSRRAGSTVVVGGPVPCSPGSRTGHVHPDGLHHGGPGAPRISGSGGWLRGHVLGEVVVHADDAIHGALFGEHDDGVEHVSPGSWMMVDDDETSFTHRGGNEVAHLTAGLWVEHGHRLVEQHETGVAGEHPGKSQPLHLAPGHLQGLVVQPRLQAHPVVQIGDQWPHPFPGLLQVLRTKGGVPPDSFGDDGVLRVLLEQTNRPGGVVSTLHRPVEKVALLVQQTAQGVQQSRLAGPGRPGEQHPGTGWQVEVEGSEDGVDGPRRGHREATNRDPRGGGSRRHLASEACRRARSRPTGKELSAPAPASPLTMSWPRTPARTAPEMRQKIM